MKRKKIIFQKVVFTEQQNIFIYLQTKTISIQQQNLQSKLNVFKSILNFAKRMIANKTHDSTFKCIY